MRRIFVLAPLLLAGTALAANPPLVVKPDAFETLVNPNCSHCVDEAKRRAGELRADDRVLCWTRGYSDGGAIPYRFFLNAYPVISDSYGVFVSDPNAGFARGFAPSYRFRFHGWRNGVMVIEELPSKNSPRGDKDGTLYSALSGVAFDGPKKGTRLTPIPTVVSDWGFWLERYPHAVAYHMFDKYKPVDLPAAANKDAAASRGRADPRLPVDEPVLGVWTGKSARAYPVAALSKAGLIVDEIDGQKCFLLWQPKTKTASAYFPEASPPRKHPAPHPNADGISPPDDAPDGPRKTVTLRLDNKVAAAPFVDEQTGSRWDVAGRAVEGELKGYTLTWLDSVQVKWFAWAAEYPKTSVYGSDAAKEVAGTAEFLRLLPKPWATLKAVNPKGLTVDLLLDGENVVKTWPVEADAEVKVGGWWGRLDQLRPGDRVWVWLKLNRKKAPVSVVMLADKVSEFDMHGSLRKPATGEKPKFTAEQVEAKRKEQKSWLRKRWAEDGLPCTLTFHHVFSGELEITLDHEAMRWGRSLKVGDVVHLTAEPAIKGVVKAVSPWRERTVVRLVVGELESSELKIGQRLGLKMAAPPSAVDDGAYPPDIDRPRTGAARVEWFLASSYCSCGVGKDTCTGQFYTLASCNPNGCGMPNRVRKEVAGLIERGLSDRQIWDDLVKSHGPLMLRPHLAP